MADKFLRHMCELFIFLKVFKPILTGKGPKCGFCLR